MIRTGRQMNKKLIRQVVFIPLLLVGFCWAGGCAKESSCSKQKAVESGPVEIALKQLSGATGSLKTYHCRIEYLTSQPLFESQTLRCGELYYHKSEKKSQLRINFQTIKQDDEKQQKYLEQFIFDGLWLTQIDYQLKEVKYRQLAEPNEPNQSTDVFEIVSGNFPIIGFTNIEELEKDFEIKLIEHNQPELKGFTHLHLRVTENSVYKDDYSSIEFWIDNQLHLPARIVATTIEEDIYQIELLDAKVNKKLGKNVFEVKIHEGFNTETIPIKKSEH